MKGLVIIALGVVLVTCGCVRYLEQETPAGSVPRAQVGILPGVEQGLQQAYKAETVETEPDSQPAIERFSQAYVQAEQPRIAVYLNRALSDEVREWKADKRFVVAESVKAQGSLTLATEGTGARGSIAAVGDNGRMAPDSMLTADGRFAAQGGGGVSVQTLMEEPSRPRLEEVQEWAFEDGFLQPLLTAGAKVVDRATILRLTAAETGTQDAANPQLSAKNVEMNALKGHADIFVEILINARGENGDGRYEFKVAAKEVKSGLILANLTTHYPETQRPGNRAQLPGVKPASGKEEYESGGALALNLMDALAKRWTP